MQIHPSEISPGEPFGLFYFIRNWQDNATYYVRAVIYDLKTGEVLATQNLSQAATNPRLFLATLQAPADPGSIGRNMVAIASVYTDSGYTTKAEYEEQEQYFLIRSAIPSGGGGGVDYEAVRDIVGSEMTKQKLLKLEDLPLDSLFGTLGALQREINRIPKDAVDLMPVASAIADVRQAIADLPEPEPVNLQPVLDRVASSERTVLQAITALPGLLTTKLADASDAVMQTGKDIIGRIEITLEKAAKAIVTHATKALDRELGQKQITLSMGQIAEKSKEPEPSDIDLSHLMRL